MKRTPFKRSQKPFKKKARKISLGGLKKKAWDALSIYIRQKDADENGVTSCISCGKMDHWKNLQCGHYRPKSLGLSVYFVEKNLGPQCRRCNLTLQGNSKFYAIALEKKYGKEVVEELENLHNTHVKYSKADYLEMIEKYKALIKEESPGSCSGSAGDRVGYFGGVTTEGAIIGRTTSSA